jgi:hypothetical protein
LDLNDVIPYKTSRKKYDITFVRDDGIQLSEDEIDLAADPVAFETVGAPKTSQLGAIYLRTADYVRLAGLPREYENAYKKRAFASLVAEEEYKPVFSVAADLRGHLALADQDWQHAYSISLENKNQPRRGQKGWPFGPGGIYVETEQEKERESEVGAPALARLEKLAGDFGRAAYFYEKSAKNISTENPQARNFAIQAYFAYGASLEPEEARRIRNTYELVVQKNCPRCVESEQAAIREHSPSAYEEFESLCLIRALSHLDY